MTKLQIRTTSGTYSGTLLYAKPSGLAIRDRDGRTIRISAESIVGIYKLGGVR